MTFQSPVSPTSGAPSGGGATCGRSEPLLVSGRISSSAGSDAAATGHAGFGGSFNELSSPTVLNKCVGSLRSRNFVYTIDQNVVKINVEVKRCSLMLILIKISKILCCSIGHFGDPLTDKK
jgi:hypothetical protein